MSEPIKRETLENSKLYRTWKSINSRYKKGKIEVCSEWLHSYEVFKKWAINNGYDDSKRISRIDKKEGYCPENCLIANTIGIKKENNDLYHIWHRAKKNKMICEEWKNSFESFVNWYKEQEHKDNWKVMRIDKDCPYSPENCIVAEPLGAKDKYFKLYRIHKNMNSRCNKPGTNKYEYYGGRGIQVCKEWESFYNFKKWALKNGYKEGLSIERKNVNGNYEPNNCEWITIQEQQLNRRNTIKISYKGKEYLVNELSELTGVKASVIYARHQEGCVEEELLQYKSSYIEFRGENYTPKQLADKLGMNVDTLRNRYHRYGYRGEKLAKEVQRKKQASVEINGEKKTLKQLEKETGIAYNTLKQRYDNGHRGKEILKEPKVFEHLNLIYDGKNVSLAKLSKLSGISLSTLSKRVKKLRETMESKDITTEKVIASKKNVKLYEINGESKTVKEWADLAGISTQLFRNRYTRGFRGKELLSPPQSGNQYTKQKNNDNDSEQLGFPL